MAILLSASLAHATMGPIPGEEMFQGAMGQEENKFSTEMGFGRIGEDYFLQITPRLELNFDRVGIGLQIPLNLRVWDREPKNDDDYFKIIRREDWDEPLEFLRVIRYVRFGKKRDFIYARVGELAATLGHGTIMARYLNNVDFNTFRLGTELDINTNYGGVETVISDVPGLALNAPNSKLVGVRGYVKPYAFVDPESFLNIISLGVTVVTDINAPRSLGLDPDTGNPRMDGPFVEVEDAAPNVIYGFDLEAQVLNSDLLSITPYTDFNVIAQAGWGWHAGVLFDFALSFGIDVRMPVRLEYRRFASNYIPIYYSTFYEIERYGFPVGPNSNPKAQMVRDLPSGGGLNGYYGDLAFDFSGIVQIGAIYEDYDGINPNLAAFVNVPALDWLQFKAFYARTGIDGAGDIFGLDDRSIAIAEARYQLFSVVYLVGRWMRRWALVTDQSSADHGTYRAEDNWNVGIEAGFSF